MFMLQAPHFLSGASTLSLLVQESDVYKLARLNFCNLIIIYILFSLTTQTYKWSDYLQKNVCHNNL
jgi:hypothetical protein